MPTEPMIPPPNGPRAGFSLMELVIVLLILVTIAGIAIPRLSRVDERAMDALRIEALTELEAALEAFRADHGAYPEVRGWQGDAPDYGDHGYGAQGYVPGLVPDYLEQLPRDPDDQYPSESRGFLYKSDGKDYKLLAFKTPNSYPTDHRFYDPQRSTWAYQVSTRDARGW